MVRMERMGIPGRAEMRGEVCGREGSVRVYGELRSGLLVEEEEGITMLKMEVHIEVHTTSQ